MSSEARRVETHKDEEEKLLTLQRAVEWILANKPLLLSSLGGFAKGFLMYSGAMTAIKKGKIDKSIIRRATALGMFAAVTRILDRLLKDSSKDLENNHRLRRAICGGFGTLSAILIDNTFVNSILVMWTMLRALHSIWPTSLTLPHSSTISMCFSATQILTSWYMSPEDLNRRYLSMLNVHGGKSIKDCVSKFTAGNLVNSCAVSHPGHNCGVHFFQFFGAGMLRAVKLYAPLYVVILLVSKPHSIQHAILNTLRSSVFLSLYCTLAWASICFSNWIAPNAIHTRASMYSHLWIAGLSTLVERSSRRTELAIYCATYALDSLYNRLGNLKVLKKHDPILGSTLLIFSVSVLLYYSRAPAVLIKWLLDMDVKLDHPRPQPSSSSSSGSDSSSSNSLPIQV
eukprot:TRINITY_DN6911_c0_g1_i1.p1 TRINITY_DN6911_c0_g1~~TRINITY_DN6911_c0_g1_i1.p1  ORF type:complete len:399 (-),score=141.35 TRINITY_DN6911_c0_g1_i1:77-1273(-)